MAPPQKRVARGQAKQRNLPLFDAFTDSAMSGQAVALLQVEIGLLLCMQELAFQDAEPLAHVLKVERTAKVLAL